MRFQNCVFATNCTLTFRISQSKFYWQWNYLKLYLDHDAYHHHQQQQQNRLSRLEIHAIQDLRKLIRLVF